jgi:LPS-assembly protein
VPYRDQSHIYNYDSSLLQSDYSGLFRDRTYGGLDRIASANQVTTGVTSRVYDDAAVERFNISVGQIYYFTESRTGDDNIKWEKDDKTGSLVWAGDTYWRISDRWGLRGGMQYDTRLDNIATSSSSIEYRRDENRMLQLNYRYASPEYIQATLPSYYVRQSSIKRYFAGGRSGKLPDRRPLVDCRRLLLRYQREQRSRPMLGLQYNSCCYAIRFGYERKLNGWDNTKTRDL